MRIYVGIKDLEKGRIGDPRSCAVALAIQRRLPDKTVTVFASNVRIGPWFNEEKKIPLSRSVQKKITRIDQGILINPFSFELKIPE